MLRYKWALESLDVGQLPRRTQLVHRCLASPAKSYDDEDHREARTWLAKFNANTIPKNICEVTFSRSSGPGGQNVNKYDRGASSLQEKLQV